MRQLLLENQKLNQKFSLNLKFLFFTASINPKFFFRSCPIYILFQWVDRFAEFRFWKNDRVIFFFYPIFLLAAQDLRTKAYTKPLHYRFPTPLPGQLAIIPSSQGTQKNVRNPIMLFYDLLISGNEPSQTQFQSLQTSSGGAIWGFNDHMVFQVGWIIILFQKGPETILL